MVVDIHYHLFDRTFHNAAMWDDIARICVTFSPPDKPITLEEAKDKLLPQMFDPTGEVTVRNLDRWGIDNATVVAVDSGLMHGDGEIGIEGQNKAIAEAARRFPDRLIAFLSVDPRRPNALEIVDRCVNDWGMRGLKCQRRIPWEKAHLALQIISYIFDNFIGIGARAKDLCYPCLFERSYILLRNDTPSNNQDIMYSLLL